MDWLRIRSEFAQRFGKYKYVLLIIAVGIFLMLLPSGNESEPVVATPSDAQNTDSMEEKLELILCQIRGVGKVKVLLTEETGAETVYQVDAERTEGDGTLRMKQETLILSANGGQSGLVRTVSPPTYLGAIIVCQGADSPTVRLAVANAVSAVTGIGMDRISVLEMK